MKPEDMPFNMSFHYGDDLREVPDDPEQMRKGIEWLQERLDGEGNDDIQQAALMSQIGVFSRILGDLDNAEQMLIQAHTLLKEMGSPIHAFATNLRLAVVFQWRKNYSKSDDIYFKSLKKIRTSKDPKVLKYLDFVLQHYGKSKFEQGFFNEALELFMEGYEARLAKGDMDLISSTEAAISACRKKLGESS